VLTFGQISQRPLAVITLVLLLTVLMQEELAQARQQEP